MAVPILPVMDKYQDLGILLMLRIIQITQTVFCLVSMTLTGLFALSLSGLDTTTLTIDGFNQSALLAVLFILIGCCIDTGKYLFWVQRHRSYAYVVLALILMVFSWLASCAFLVSSEGRLLEVAQQESVESVVIQRRISSLTQSIAHQERLLENQLGSSYHTQWEAGQNTAKQISDLQASLAHLIEQSSLAGREAALEQVATTRFFSHLGSVFKVRVETVRAFGYGVLSLLLEISTLGMISLAAILQMEARREKSGEGSAIDESPKPKRQSGSSDQAVQASQYAIIQLVSDIVSGQMPPVARKVKAAKYGIPFTEVQTILKRLHAVGLLVTDKRNSYKLASSPVDKREVGV